MMAGRTFLAPVCAALCAAAAVAEPLTFERPKDEPFVSLTNLEWRLPKGVRIEGNILTVDAPAGAKGDFLATADVDLSAYNAKGFEAQIDAWGENLTKPDPPWLGFKFMFSYKDPTSGYATYPEAPKLDGSFARRTFTVLEGSPCQGRIHGKLTLGLQGTTGRVSYDLSTLKIRGKGRQRGLVNQDFMVRYPARVTDRPRLRGVMLPGRPCTEKDLADLSAWGGTLARYQMCVKGKTEADYDRDLEVWISALEKDILGWARKYGVMLVVDLHSLPGGRYPDRKAEPDAPGMPSDFRMLYEERHARRFVAIWEKIATRLRGNEDIIYGYDLCNEPVQKAPPLVDFLELQRFTAEAVRRIDPMTTIIIEADQWDNPEAFATLSPLRMDNVIYQFHLYRPHELTHQRVGGDADSRKPLMGYPNESRGWNRAFLEKSVADVVRFQRKHDARIFVGEFSCITWTPGADRYIADCIDLFEEHGWDWTYHAFREWHGWSVEHEWKDRKTTQPVPSEDNPRMRALKAGFRRGNRK